MTKTDALRGREAFEKLEEFLSIHYRTKLEAMGAWQSIRFLIEQRMDALVHKATVIFDIRGSDKPLGDEGDNDE